MTHDVSPGDVLDRLRTVTDPDIGQNIVTAGLVDAVSVDDGYAIYVLIADALDGVVASKRDDEPLRETQGYALRFLASDIEGERLMKGVSRIDLLSPPADADPDRYETVTLDDPEYE